MDRLGNCRLVFGDYKPKAKPTPDQSSDGRAAEAPSSALISFSQQTVLQSAEVPKSAEEPPRPTTLVSSRFVVFFVDLFFNLLVLSNQEQPTRK